MLQSDQIINPETGHFIDKYGKTWWQLIRKKHKEDELESQKTIINHPTILTTIHQLPLHYLNPIRAGVIIYTIVKNRLLFGFGLDAVYNQLTDFAGGITKKDKNIISAALREFCEETLGVFCNINIQKIQKAPVLYDKHHVVILLYTNEDIDDINNKFHEYKKYHKGKIEISNIVWITKEELQDAIFYKQSYMYLRLINFLKKADRFYDYLL
ncbi:MAG TPA: NUDIX hydrolase [Candidatus Saccharimonadales bacterium]|nr:NUDIX hydrolase [Candidatus Saccharimonadales bacterium]